MILRRTTNMSNNTNNANPMKVITGKDTRWSYANVFLMQKLFNVGAETTLILVSASKHDVMILL